MISTTRLRKNVKPFDKDVAGNDKAMSSALEIGPVSVAIEADKSAFQLYKSGVLSSNACGTKLDGEFIELNSKYELLDNKIELLDSKLDGELVDLRGEMSDISSKLDMILASLK